MFVAVPALICATLVFFTVRDPIRGDQEQETRNLRAQRQLEVAETAGASHTVLPERHILRDRSSPSPPPRYFVVDQLIAALSTEESENVTHERANEANLEQHRLTAVELLTPQVLVEYSEHIDCSKVITLFSTPSVALIFVQGFPGCLPWGMIYVFLNDYFSTDRGMSVQEATAALTLFGIGGLAGMIFGGWAGQKLYNIDKRLQCVFMGMTTLISVLPMLYLLNTENVNTAGFYFMALFAGFMVSMNGPNVRAVLQVNLQNILILGLVRMCCSF